MRAPTKTSLPMLALVVALVLAGAVQVPPGEGAAGPPEAQRVAGPVPELGSVQKIRSIATAEHGVDHPTGIAWSTDQGALVLSSRTGKDGRLRSILPDESRVGRVKVAGSGPGAVLTENPADHSLTVVRGRKALRVAGRALAGREPARSRRVMGDLPAGARGAAYDTRGRLVVLKGRSLVRPGGWPTRKLAGLDGHDLRGLATHPETGELFTYDATTKRLLAITGGQVTKIYGAADLGVDNVRGLVFGPSADRTDHSSVLSVYVLDEGAPGNYGEVVEGWLTSDFQLVANVDPSDVRIVETSAYDPPSPDPSGIAFLPAADRLFIVDGEVDEMPIFEGSNFFEITRAGAVTDVGVSQPWSDEPVGVGYNPLNNHLFVTDDDQKEVFEIVAGSDGRFGTADDTVTHFDTASSGNTDPEGVEYDAATNSLWFTDGVNAQIFRVRAGNDGAFGTGDDVKSNFDIGIHGARDPEGIGYDPVRDTLVVVDDSSETIYEIDKSGALLNTIDISSAGMDAAAGIAVAPASDGSGARTYYVVARGLDNDSHPTENDGRLYEITATLPPLGGGPPNQAPVVSAGPDLTVTLPAVADLDGTVSDDGLPTPPGVVSTTWSQVSGPGSVTFGDPAAVDTTATFTQAGTYILRLDAGDGQAISADEVVVFVAPVGGGSLIEVRVGAGSDDAEQALSGFVGLGSSDLELTTDGNTQQVVGVRFAGLAVPAGAQVTAAWVQFTTDENSTGASQMQIRAEAADSTATYASVSGNVTSRSTTAASVAWSPPEWTVRGQAAAGQRTPDLSGLVQAVVDRAGWDSGNALALQFSGTGRRVAESFNGSSAAAPLLHVEFTAGGGGGPRNQAPVVSAGPDLPVTLPAVADLDGTVSDDGLPTPPGVVSTTWSQVSGPGSVTFGDPAAVDTTATFSGPGVYVLRLRADDGALQVSDQTTVTVQAEGGGGIPQSVEVRVGAGSDDAEQALSGFVGLGSSDLELTTDGNTQQVVGVRFAGLAVPAGAQVTAAWVQFTTDENSTGASQMQIRAEAADSTATYASVSGNVTSRSTTAASVAWSPPEWTVRGQAAAGQRTPDLSGLVQAVVDRAGWDSGNALALQFSGTGRRVAESFNGSSAAAPLLHVEFTAGGGGGPRNQAPVVSAGPDLPVTLPAVADLDGTVSDDGLPTPPGVVSTTWSQVSGPGSVTFGDPAAVDTTATFSGPGVYVLRLRADDGALQVSDQTTVTVQAEGGGGIPQSVEVRVGAGSDDAEQALSGFVGLGSSDLELTTDGNTQQVVGVRFAGLAVPAGAQVTAAWVQFTTDENSTGASQMQIRAEAADSTATYASVSGNVTSRSTTAASVAWSPPEWTVRGQAAAGQRTPDLSGLVQAVVDRAGWDSGNALALQFSGTGRRVAESFNGSSAAAPLLHVEFTAGGGGGPRNQAPVVSAGPDLPVTLPAVADLDGTVSDDGLPTPPGVVSTTWSQVSGPGSVTFGDPAAVDTTATFSGPGVYVLRLRADDGALQVSDQTTVTVQAEGGGGIPQSVEVRVGAGSDDAEQALSGFVGLGSSDLELTTDGNTQQVVGVRFAGLAVPAGAQVTAAWVQFTTDENSTGASQMQIRAEAADSTATYASVSGNVTSRSTTAASVAWSPPEWTVRGQAAAGQRTPDLSGLVQAVVDRAGWDSGNALALQFSGTGRRVAESFNGSSAAAPLLHVEFTTAE